MIKLKYLLTLDMQHNNGVKKGNILSYMGIGYVIVEEVFGDKIRVAKSTTDISNPDRIIMLANLSGVNITKANLLKLGFQETQVFSTVVMLQVQLTEVNGKWFYGGIDTLDLNKPIEYFHELQNFLSKELTIQLDIWPLLTE